jgi:ABC-type antimicrobial peptide transport system permease subunit
MAYLVGLRTREFGIRLALGARPGQIVRLVLDRAIHVVLVGLLAGVITATLASQLMANQVFGLSPNPLAVWIAAPLLVLGLGVAAGYLPARRAPRVDPNVALRES